MEYSSKDYSPAVLRSICTGERTFGFIRKTDGHFIGISLVRTDKELSDLKKEYKVTEEVNEIY